MTTLVIRLVDKVPAILLITQTSEIRPVGIPTDVQIKAELHHQQMVLRPNYCCHLWRQQLMTTMMIRPMDYYRQIRRFGQWLGSQQSCGQWRNPGTSNGPRDGVVVVI